MYSTERQITDAAATAGRQEGTGVRALADTSTEPAQPLAGSPSITRFDGPDIDMLIRQGFRPARIESLTTVARGILSITFAPPLGADPAFTPGAHLEVAIPLPDGPAIRHYSLCSKPDGSDGWRVAILNEPTGRGGSRWLHEHLADCTSLLIRGPRDTFGYQRRSPMLFVAGGIGITPISAMIHDAENAGLDWHLIYVGRRNELMAFADDLIDSHGSERVDVRITAETGRPDVVALARDWFATAGQHPSGGTAPEAEGTDGTATEAQGTDDSHVASACGPVVYTCGPVPLMRALAAGMEAEGIEVIFEDFDDDAPPAVEATGSGQAEAAGASGADTAFTVETTSGAEVQVACGQSILAALGAAGVRTLSSCQKGTCGTCETTILQGRADHRDHVLSGEEKEAQETMMICVSRAQTDRLVLDI